MRLVVVECLLSRSTGDGALRVVRGLGGASIPCRGDGCRGDELRIVLRSSCCRCEGARLERCPSCRGEGDLVVLVLRGEGTLRELLLRVLPLLLLCLGSGG